MHVAFSHLSVSYRPRSVQYLFKAIKHGIIFYYIIKTVTSWTFNLFLVFINTVVVNTMKHIAQILFSLKNKIVEKLNILTYINKLPFRNIAPTHILTNNIWLWLMVSAINKLLLFLIFMYLIGITCLYCHSNLFDY